MLPIGNCANNFNIKRQQKIKLQSIQETKQLFKSDLNYLGFVKSFYFHIDPSAFSPYQKKRLTLQYLANCFQLIKVESINLLQFNDNNLAQINRIFQGINNLKIKKQTLSNLNTKWQVDIIYSNVSDEKINEIQFIENPKINTGWQAVQQNQYIKDDYIQLSAEYQALIPNDLRRSLNLYISISGLIVNDKKTFLFFLSDLIVNQLQIIDDNQQSLLVQIETHEQIIIDAKNQIDSITKRDLYTQSVGNIQFLLKLYDYFEVWSKLNQYQATIQTFWSVLNGSLQIVSLIYLNNESNMFISALIALTSINPILQMLSFAVFQQRVFKKFHLQYNCLIFFYLQYLTFQRFGISCKQNVQWLRILKVQELCLKFSGCIATSVFKNEKVQTYPNDIKQIKDQPFYEAVMWRTNVEEALNKIPQFFVYILSLAYTQFDGIWVFSFGQQIKEGIFAVKDLLEVLIKDYFIPALILSTVSVD
ncbi:unnamed protein product [Paramecium pentaurelia]|uniref:Uncharacterized protein n=1 Tax=Paramecium pentaurelia TaxID=43138 RepID=A0A8S1YGD5_9CILI|nr:unnamed protein product [Paramecium pentaurelia]